MNFKRAIVAITSFAAALTLGASVVRATDSNNPNDAPYWQARTTHVSQCFKHTPQDSPNAHGSITNGNKAVTLNTFNQTWFGDHWELLVVNGGNGNTVIDHPSAGVAYFPPLNNGGQHPNISHWIVCKGETPTPTTTTVVVTTTQPPTTTAAPTTTTEAPTTTTEAPTTTTEAPTTTVEVTTTLPPDTTVPETTVPETTVPETTVPETTIPETTTTTTEAPTTTAIVTTTTVEVTTPPTPPTTTVVSQPVSLPQTGNDTALKLAIAGMLLIVGTGAMFGARRKNT